MKLSQLFEAADDDHHEALRTTGFFGKMGAGCVFLARDTGRLLIAHRSGAVEQPHTWGGWGGAVNAGESPEEGVRREVAEEAGYHGAYDLIPLYVFKSGTFQYHNFLVEVDSEFHPVLDWETQGYEWVEWGEWPEPLHFGLVSLFSDARSARIIKNAISEIQGSVHEEEEPRVRQIHTREVEPGRWQFGQDRADFKSILWYAGTYASEKLANKAADRRINTTPGMTRG